jgi:hypothetical protein
MSINEGQTIQYTVTTTNTADGTVLYWKTTGNVHLDQIANSNGTMTVVNNRATFNVTTLVNHITDGNNIIGISLSTGSLTGPAVVNTANPILINDTSLSPAPYSINYLVVGGGGSAGFAGCVSSAGGGGAGGVLSGSTILSGGVYSITVGAGAAGSTVGGDPSTPGNNGTNSIIYNNCTSSNVAVAFGGGFGAGGSYNRGPWISTGNPGGSGGGGGAQGASACTANNSSYGPLSPPAYVVGGAGYNYPGPTQQGYPGGNGKVVRYNWCVPGPGMAAFAGGGGGAGAAGYSSTPSRSGAGGNGYTWPYTANTYGGGGAGGGGYYCGATISGGTGGGGPSGPFSPTYYTNTGSPGVQNTGGGSGAGSAGCNRPSGGSGIVILAVPVAGYPGSAPGATVTCAPPSYPGVKLITYTTSGTYTA